MSNDRIRSIGQFRSIIDQNIDRRSIDFKGRFFGFDGKNQVIGKNGKWKNGWSTGRPSLWTMLVLAVAMLTILNVFISFKLTHNVDMNSSGITTKTGSGVGILTGSIDKSNCHDYLQRTSGFHFINGSGRFDNSRKYLIHDSVEIGDAWSSLNQSNYVCLATQTSVDRLHWLSQVTGHWQNIISVAVFVPGDDFQIAVQYLNYLRQCFPQVRSLITFHFLYPVDNWPSIFTPEDMNKTMESSSCDLGLSPETVLNRILSKYRRIGTGTGSVSIPGTGTGTSSSRFQQWRRSSAHILYPQNHLRNVARKGCPTPYVFLTDVDIVPRPGLGPSLDRFLAYPECGDSNCAFVVPTYEVDEKILMPCNKSILIQLIKEKKAQPFHQVVFINNQFATNASQWEKMSEGQHITIAYPVTNFELFYEPFYVAKDDVPPHDERFVGYGFTRNTQVYEMFMANFKFLVLNYAFAVHRGLKRRKTKNSWREKQNRANARLFKKFEREVMARHGNSFNYAQNKRN